jgi:alanine racemase
MSRGTRAIVHPDHLRHNLALAQHSAPNCSVWAVVKANAYGHGLVPVAQLFAPLSHGLAVATLDEALTLRAAGIQASILLMEGVVNAAQTQQALAAGLELGIHQRDQISWLAQATVSNPVRVWLKIDTGMHRLGVSPAEASAVLAELEALPQVSSVAVMSHYACADDPSSVVTAEQFQQIAPWLRGRESSLANSAAVLFWPEYQGNWVRPGIMLYGASPSVTHSATSLGLRPTMTLQAPIIALRDVQPGDAIGYGASFQVITPMRVATLAMGYADGYPRHAPNGTPAALHGQRIRVVGRISMDMMMVDVSAVSSAQIGDFVELWGNTVSVDEVAQAAGTIGYELLARLSIRGETLYQDASPAKN